MTKDVTWTYSHGQIQTLGLDQPFMASVVAEAACIVVDKHSGSFASGLVLAGGCK